MSPHPLLLQIFQSSGISPSTLTQKGNLFSSPSHNYITKVGPDILQIRAEAFGLRAMSLTAPDLIPRPLGFQIDNQTAGFISEYLHLTRYVGQESQRELGRQLAEMHRKPPEGTAGYTGLYGFDVPTFCGRTEQDNTWEESWEVFFRDRHEWEIMKEKRVVSLLLTNFYPPPEPVIIHGDLWSGNVGWEKDTGRPVIFDPACYWGHNEVELGMTHMFGGRLAHPSY
ncbi:hypothetical protein TREMEDRAFT_58482 [Tremella mesenterica DSM 1558]|uniref:uncharacterized protein n=1 Tax=Tremella mesenterica (strain ATCC 24925 / CBS 8224 / DSM 1558 / NBRC 9311 / NRRL Y-6157 / RJB 2259-6 / UBC 559-6) TaxID=578456 RepID=UPI0003F49B86|nr:uncharacterized protein TREMEDRAFT_58482 [Tremella mesenterica DSM 1558]EIW72318.1 hypothetical protein TREMEDRAFT_58482 [Tremella mesenterica DSM 1558]